ncbi:DHH family phosphoesterase [uncultured Ruminococcus sp.]|uniref:DHH family phosphoesterase n=1 Tax=uncultured Ruminococcus sp. TaxID=165186 RepID=UPI0025CD6B90|nr:DHH family phosphoesterase [uncultured Ruminococcus sp.]
MKKNRNFLVLLGATMGVIAVVALIGAFMLHSTVEKQGSGSVLILVSVVSILLLLLEAFVFRNQTHKYLTKTATQLVRTQRDSLLYFPAPCVILDNENSVVWFNKLFEENMYDIDPYGEQLTEIMNIDLDRAYGEEGCQICLNKRYYVAHAVQSDLRNGLSMVYFKDVTDYTELRYEAYQSHNGVIIIVIDNYDAMMSDIRESEKAHVAVEIEKLMERFLEGTTAIAKKVSDDKFYVFMEERYLSRKIENRFRILEEARQIRIGGKTNVTLSIGVGREGKGLEECEKLAKQALELCQGRGGDQAAYRENGEFRFFGGVSAGADNNNRVKIRIFAETLLEIIKPGSIESMGNYRTEAEDAQGFRRVLIMGHRFGDLDSIGSATGLCCALRKMVSECYVVVDKEKNLALSLINYIEENEISNYYITPEQGLDRLDSDTLVIVVDTHNPELVESKEMIERAKNIVVIDHHRRMVKGIEPLIAQCLEPGASSAAELVTEIIELWGDRTSIDAHAAEALLSGIMLDTKYFVMKTGVTTFETAAYLKKMGADTITVKSMFANSIETYHEKSKVINSAEIYRKCAIARADGSFGNVRVAASQAADEMLGITGVFASFVMYKQGNIVNISARSMGRYNVQVIMEALGGGGHLTMAAAQMPVELDEAEKQLREAIDDYIRNNTK